LTWRRLGEEQLLWKFKKGGIDFDIQLERNDVHHDDFFFFGIDSDRNGHLASFHHSKKVPKLTEGN